jgi:hypothetical protein
LQSELGNTVSWVEASLQSLQSWSLSLESAPALMAKRGHGNTPRAKVAKRGHDTSRHSIFKGFNFSEMLPNFIKLNVNTILCKMNAVVFWKWNVSFATLMNSIVLFYLSVIHIFSYFLYFEKIQEILGRANRLLSLIRHGPHWKRRLQQFFYCCLCIRYRGNVCTEPLPSNDRGFFLPNRPVT